MDKNGSLLSLIFLFKFVLNKEYACLDILSAMSIRFETLRKWLTIIWTQDACYDACFEEDGYDDQVLPNPG